MRQNWQRMSRKMILSAVILALFALGSLPLYADEVTIKNCVDEVMRMGHIDLKERFGVVESSDLYGDDWEAKKLPIEGIFGRAIASFTEAGLITGNEFNQVLIELRRYHTDEEIRVALSEAQQNINKMTQGDFWDKVTSDCPGVCGDLLKILLFIPLEKIKRLPKWLLLFEIGSEEPGHEYDDLYKIKKKLESSSSGASLLLMGRGSRGTGSWKTNHILSKKRSAAVMQRLIDIGVPQDKLKRATFGYEPPYLTGTMVDEYDLWAPSINMGITPDNFSNGDWNQSVLIVLVE